MRYTFVKTDLFAYSSWYENLTEELRLYVSGGIHYPACYDEAFMRGSYRWKYKIVKTKVLTALFK